jgi:hypothetical protein
MTTFHNGFAFTGDGNLKVIDANAQAATIVAGSRTATGTLLTVPAGRTWSGTVTVSVTVVNAAGSAAENAAVWVEPAGTGANPTAGTALCRAHAAIGAAAAALNGNASSTPLAMAMWVRAPDDNDVTLEVASSGTPESFSVTACGVLY